MRYVCIVDTINCHSRISCYNMTTFRGRFVVSQNSLRNIHLKRQKDKNRKIQNDKKPKRQKAKRIKREFDIVMGTHFRTLAQFFLDGSNPKS